ncbi:uncharacterized protein LOC143286607 [Babylonia areolata]|uniref:uncharacterized protein LOC143286607 n=1 Tax=Babylonia areolata TaxID=304850 RepID=UPI003FD6703B
MEEKGAPPPSYVEIESPEDGSLNAGYTPLPGDQEGPPGTHPPSEGPATYPPASYGTTDYQPVTLAPQSSDQLGYASQACDFQKSVMMAQPKIHTVMISSVPDHMNLAVFTTVCCCWPLGLVAILRAQESRRALQQGDMISASVFASESRRFSLWAIAGGVLCLVISVVIIIVIVRLNYNVYKN